MDRSKPLLVSKDVPYVEEKATSLEAITAQLRKEEFTVTPEPTSGVTRYNISRLASNSPCEDDYTHAIMTNPLSLAPGKDWSAWGIFDGHV